ncbi:MAG: two-component system, OmpR family, response regulator [Pseudonocardiales bacterium]|jgi:DNA-binding response OmpR family regulator|nr:two-component system, OmpR family, response regulator [Pseudonocardiales bacterium]
MAHVLVVEDEPNLRVLLGRLLTNAGHRVTAAADGSSALQSAQSEAPDLVILDLMLPDLTGEEVLHALLTAQPATRVLVLSAVTEVDRRVGVFDCGAADFVAKPFGNSEFLARVRARLRGEAPTTPNTVARFMSGPDFQLDLQHRELLMGDQRIELPQREFVLLAHLLHRRGEVCTRQELLADVWGIDFDPRTNLVDVYVQRLRSKLSANSIETVRSVGYRLVAR